MIVYLQKLLWSLKAISFLLFSLHFLSMKIHENYSLRHLNTFGIDANARFFIEFKTEEEIADFIQKKTFIAEKHLILNGGSNVLFTKDFDGLVMKISTQGIETLEDNETHALVKASAGVNWDEFVKHCLDRKLGGLENLSAIPGNVGAAPMQNIGAYGVEQKHSFYSLEALNIESGNIQTFNAAACKFGYRESVFKKALKNKYIILSVTYRLSKSPEFKINYGAIQTELKNSGVEELTLKTVSEAICKIRGSKLPDPDKIGSAGSFFKNPVIDQEIYKRLKNKYPQMVAYPNPSGQHKIAAGWLIDYLGWKGYRMGDAGVCETQALVLVNYGKATGSEIWDLALDIQKSVFDEFGIQLEPEVNIIS